MSENTVTETAGRFTGRLRSKKRINYREASDVRLPRAERVQARNDNLFPVEVVEQEDKRVKIHYVGYSTKYDEWREESELEPAHSSGASKEAALSEEMCDEFEPFSLHKHLRVRIKQSLSCSRKSSPEVRIVVPFDAITFNGGLRLLGTQSKKALGLQHYTITHYADLNPLLGKNWHYRGLNVNADYGYVIMETVDFYLRKCKPLEEYVPSQEQDSESPSTCISLVDTGHSITFSFVCGYGSRSTFGKDKNIFY